MSDYQARLDELARSFLRPLLLGGPVVLGAPFGPQVGLMFGAHGRVPSDRSLVTELEVARVRALRKLLPIDTVGPISPAEWSLLAALHDLLQVTNHRLSSGISRSRHGRLLEGVVRLVLAVPAPRTTLEVLARHATLSRIGELSRTDTDVTWWTGKETFRGEPPSERLQRWPDLRRVVTTRRKVTLPHMLEGLGMVSQAAFLEALTLIYQRSPLTDLCEVGRGAPGFCWSETTMGLISYPVGQKLALRALSGWRTQLALAALQRENERLAGSPFQQRGIRFAAELTERVPLSR